MRWIIVLGDYRNCGIADFEAGNEVFAKAGALRAFVQGRTNTGTRGRVYCDRSNLELVRADLKGLNYLVWIGTLDGNKLSPDWTPGLWAAASAPSPGSRDGPGRIRREIPLRSQSVGTYPE